MRTFSLIISSTNYVAASYRSAHSHSERQLILLPSVSRSRPKAEVACKVKLPFNAHGLKPPPVRAVARAANGWAQSFIDAICCYINR